MADEAHLALLHQGVAAWNAWREREPEAQPDLRRADLRRAELTNADLARARLAEADLAMAKANLTSLTEADLSRANLSGVVLDGADLRGARLLEANLSGAVLRGARLAGADLRRAVLDRADLRRTDLREANLAEAYLGEADLTLANLRKADLRKADLRRVYLGEADLGEANLSEANLTRAQFIGTRLEQATLTGCRIYGSSVWNITLDEHTRQVDLIITPESEPTITVDNLNVAQFVYLLLNNQEIRQVIDTVGKKGVLLLGRFTLERKAVLDALRERLRQLDFVPMLFDFERPTARDFTETILTLAGLSRFIIADVTNPRSSPLELQATVPNFMVPFVPIIQEGEAPFAMLADLSGKYDWVLPLLVYDTAEKLVARLERAVVAPALRKHDELLTRKMGELRTRHLDEYA